MENPAGDMPQIEQHVDVRPLITFDHQGQQFTVTRLPAEGVPDESGSQYVPARLEIRDTKGTSHGHIVGYFLDDAVGGARFRSDDIRHEGVEVQGSTVTKKSDHIPELVRESIAQLLIQKSVRYWESSDTLLDGARIMYEALLDDPRIVGQKIRLPDREPYADKPRFRYRLSRADMPPGVEKTA
jgi:hypothetical protein